MANQGKNLLELIIWVGKMLIILTINWEDFDDYRDYLRNTNEFYDGGKSLRALAKIFLW